MSIIEYAGNETQAREKVSQPAWQRIMLLSVLGYDAAGCLVGGGLLAAAPDGRYIAMLVDIMHGFFRDFLVPGILLIGFGILTTAAFIAVLRKTRYDWLLAGLAIGGLIIWFVVEIAVLRELHWLHAMWGFPVVLGGIAAILLYTPRKMIKVLYMLGLFSSLFYIAMHVFIPMLWDSYSVASQTISELSAVDAPTRPIYVVMVIVYLLLMIAFGCGVWKSAVQNRSLRITGLMIILNGIIGLFVPPMHQREVLAAGGGSLTDTFHMILGGTQVLLMLLVIGFGGRAFGKSFRNYSVVSMGILLVLAVLTGMDSPRISENMPTPFVGIWERIFIAVFVVWIMVLAMVLLKKDRTADALTEKEG